jgi:hypothetical protein
MLLHMQGRSPEHDRALISLQAMLHSASSLDAVELTADESKRLIISVNVAIRCMTCTGHIVRIAS